MEIKLNSSKIKLKVDYQKVFQNLFDFNLGSAATEVINIDESVEASAFALLFNATHKTNIQLSKELNQEAINKSKDIVMIYKGIQDEWSNYLNQVVTLNKDFFKNIIQYNPDYLINAYILFTKYLNLINIDVPDNYNYKYYTIFRTNLLEEYNEQSEKYKKLVDFFENPISDSNDTFNKQISHYIEIGNNYTAKLQSGVDESNETLQDLYIAPFFKVYKKNLKTELSEDFVKLEKKIDINSFLTKFILEDYLPNNLREHYNMIFILGQPGQGKTSLCYKLIFDILTETNGLPSTPLFFIKIRDLHAKDFVNDTFNTLKNAIQQNIDFENDKAILILDGLDEAFMSGGLTDNDLKNLYERLNKASRQNKNLKIVLTSRLNYLKIDDPCVEGSLIVKIDVLDKKQIKDYLKKFANFYPANTLVMRIDDILKDNRYEHIEDLLQQPVLMYFIALTNIQIEAHDSKAKIYDKIFDSLAKRSWDKNGQLNHIKTELKENHLKYSKYLRQYIRSLAFEIYQSPNLHITMNTLIKLDSTNEFIKKCFNDSITNNEEAIKDISKYLLISFYFQTSNKSKDGDVAIEFFHNSLWEYLTAEYMWEENKRIILKTDEDGEYSPVRIKEYFDVLSYLIGNKELKFEIRKNLENIISLENTETQEKIFNQTNEIFFKLIAKDMLLYYDGEMEKLCAKDKMNNIFEIAWTCLYWNNINSNNKIVTNSKLNDFFFNSSPFNYHYFLKNINFDDNYYNERFIAECTIENVIFGGGFFTHFDLYENNFRNTSFKDGFGIKGMSENKFSNVNFLEISFHEHAEVINNKFKKVKIIKGSIPNESWLQKIIDNNDVDKDFITMHEVIEETVVDIYGKVIKKYYIVLKEKYRDKE